MIPLESIAYQSKDVITAMQRDVQANLTDLKVDGGATMNNFLMQFQSDLLGVEVVVPQINETTALGACYLAGLATGVYQNKEEIEKLWKKDRHFSPSIEDELRNKLYKGWQKAVEAIRVFK